MQIRSIFFTSYLPFSRIASYAFVSLVFLRKTHIYSMRTTSGEKRACTSIHKRTLNKQPLGQLTELFPGIILFIKLTCYAHLYSMTFCYSAIIIICLSSCLLQISLQIFIVCDDRPIFIIFIIIHHAQKCMTPNPACPRTVENTATRNQLHICAYPFNPQRHTQQIYNI